MTFENQLKDVRDRTDSITSFEPSLPMYLSVTATPECPYVLDISLNDLPLLSISVAKLWRNPWA